MFSPIARWSALSALLFLGATVLPSSLQGQRSAAADRGNIAAQTLTVLANPLPINTGAKAGSAETSIMVGRTGPAPVVAPYHTHSHPLLIPLGMTMPVQARPLDFSIAPRQDEGLNLGSNLALMVIGGAGLVTGLVLDSDAGTVIAVAGGAVFLVGFYRWLK